MTTKARSPGKTAISVSMTEDLLAQMDARAASLHLNRSQYLAELARADLAQGGPLTLTDTSSTKVDAAVATTVSYVGQKILKKRKP